eukprot:2044116-Pyramimonas_sp.AAC.1
MGCFGARAVERRGGGEVEQGEVPPKLRGSIRLLPGGGALRPAEHRLEHLRGGGGSAHGGRNAPPPHGEPRGEPPPPL